MREFKFFLKKYHKKPMRALIPFFAVQQTREAAEETGQLRPAAGRHGDAANPDDGEVKITLV